MFRDRLAAPMKTLAHLALVGLAALLGGCPVTGGSARPDGGPGDGDDDGDDDGACEPARSCPVVFRYDGAATNVELRGDFAPGAWETGRPLEAKDGGFELALDLAHGQVVQYKLVVDGVWMLDPQNPDTIDDGHGNQNSVVTADCDDCDAAGFDWRDGVMYFVFLDRFRNGDTTNDGPGGGVEAAAAYHGGDLAGVRLALEDGYFDDLGVNVLWLTSPIDNADGAYVGDDGHSYTAYHGYWPRDLEASEARFGDREALAEVVDAAHARGIKVVLDYVMNHVSIESPLYAEHPDWFWPLDAGGRECVCGGGCGWGGSDGRRCWFRSYLPDFDFTNGAARAWSVDNAIRWAKDTGVDGYRLDAVKHIETSWITDLRARLRAELGPDRFYLVGETFDGDRGLIGGYVDPKTMLDGQFDFPLRAHLAREILARQGSMADLDGFLASNDAFYGAGAVMGTFIGNHDLPRPVHIAEDSPVFGEWDSGKWKAWDALPAVPGYPRPFERLAVAWAFLMTTKGIPLIYYGDEIGMAGGGDPDNRRPMQWDGLATEQAWLREQIASLAALRAAHPALRRGTRATLGVSTDAYVYEMRGAGDRVVVALNRGDTAVTAPGLPAGDYVDLATGATVSAPLELPPRSWTALGTGSASQ
jgi:glycosidase